MALSRNRLLVAVTVLPAALALVGGLLWGPTLVQAQPKDKCYICVNNGGVYSCQEITGFGGFGKTCKATKTGCNFTGICGSGATEEAQGDFYRVDAVVVD